MIHILLMILKIIGIILLAILALCLLVLFFPVTYQIRGQLNENSYRIFVKGGWLFHLIHFGGKFTNQEYKARIWILGIPINLLKEKKENSKPNKSVKKKKNSEGKIKKETLPEKKHSEENTLKEKPAQTQQKKKDNQKEQYLEQKKEMDKPDESLEGRKKFFDRLKEFFGKIYQWIEKIGTFLKKSFSNIKATYNKAKEFKAFITANTTKEAYRYGKRIVLKVIKHIFPNKIRADIQLGFEEPDITGKVLGYIAMLFAVFHINPKKVSIEPYFDKNVIKGNIKMKGHFLIGVLLIYVLKFYFKKEIHDIIKKFS